MIATKDQIGQQLQAVDTRRIEGTTFCQIFVSPGPARNTPTRSSDPCAPPARKRRSPSPQFCLRSCASLPDPARAVRPRLLSSAVLGLVLIAVARNDVRSGQLDSGERGWADADLTRNASAARPQLGTFMGVPGPGDGDDLGHDRKIVRPARICTHAKQRPDSGQGAALICSVAREGIEPPTRGFSVRCSTN